MNFFKAPLIADGSPQFLTADKVTIVTCNGAAEADICDMTDKTLVWFSRTLRWSLGAVFITTGIIYFKEGAWPAILFGGVLFITGFFRPRRCMGDNCEI